MGWIWSYSDEAIALALLFGSHFSGWVCGAGLVGLLAWRRRRPSLRVVPPEVLLAPAARKSCA